MPEDILIGNQPTIDAKERIEWGDDWILWPYMTERKLMQKIKRGREGANTGLYNGSKLMSKFIKGTHKGRYYLIGADSGVGKTTLTDYMYLYCLWKAAKAKGVKITFLYFSFELQYEVKEAKWTNMFYQEMFNESLPLDYIEGTLETKRLSDEHFQRFQEAYNAMDQMLKDVKVYDTPLTPNGILDVCIAHYMERGTILRIGEGVSGQKEGAICGYIPNDPDEMTVVIVDHIGLTAEETQAQTTKQRMDKLSMYFVHLRNIFNMTIVAIQQFSTDLESASRQKGGKKEESSFTPSRLDFGESKFLYRDADVVMGLIKPSTFDLAYYGGYSLIGGLGDYFIANHLLKNRYGQSDRMVPMFINYLTGVLEDMPPLHDYDGIARMENYHKYLAYQNWLYSDPI